MYSNRLFAILFTLMFKKLDHQFSSYYCNVSTHTHTHTFTGTVVASDNKPGVLKPEHKTIIEELKDTIERELGEYRATQQQTS